MTATQDTTPAWPEFAAPLGSVLRKGFDYAGFSAAITAETRLTPEQKQHALALFDPAAELVLKATSPIAGITAHIEAGASRDGKQPAEMRGRQHFNREHEEELPSGHPLLRMWDEVWQQTLVHYAAEAVEYEQTMTARGKPPLDDPSGFPARTPPLSLNAGMGIINAAATLSDEGKARVVVTRGFLDKLTPDEQRSILFHEAQHAFEAVLEGRTPAESMVLHKLGSAFTSNHVSRHFEHRADHHAAHMGGGDVVESAFAKMEQDQIRYFRHRAVVMHHLDASGFAVDAQAVGQTAGKMTAQALQERKTTAPQADADATRQPPMLLRKLAHAAEKVNDAALRKQVDALNAGIGKAAVQGAPAETQAKAPAAPQQPQPQPQPQKAGNFRDRLASTAGNLAKRLKEAQRTHPPTAERIERAQKVKPCQGCASPSPFASHGDRVRAISDSGIQGIVARR